MLSSRNSVSPHCSGIQSRYSMMAVMSTAMHFDSPRLVSAISSRSPSFDKLRTRMALGTGSRAPRSAGMTDHGARPSPMSQYSPAITSAAERQSGISTCSSGACCEHEA